MSMTDPVADMLTRMRNALAIRHAEVDVPRSKLKLGIADALKREGFIEDFLDIEAGAKSTLRIKLKYGPEGTQLVRKLQRVSKPGRRVYSSASELEAPRAAQGVYVLSTDRGVLSDREARTQNTGGEVLCLIY